MIDAWHFVCVLHLFFAMEDASFILTVLAIYLGSVSIFTGSPNLKAALQSRWALVCVCVWRTGAMMTPGLRCFLIVWRYKNLHRMHSQCRGVKHNLRSTEYCNNHFWSTGGLRGSRGCLWKILFSLSVYDMMIWYIVKDHWFNTFFLYKVTIGFLYWDNQIKSRRTGSMYGTFTYIWLVVLVNIGKHMPYLDPMGMSIQASKYKIPKEYYSNISNKIMCTPARVPMLSCFVEWKSLSNNPIMLLQVVQWHLTLVQDASFGLRFGDPTLSGGTSSLGAVKIAIECISPVPRSGDGYDDLTISWCQKKQNDWQIVFVRFPFQNSINMF